MTVRPLATLAVALLMPLLAGGAAHAQYWEGSPFTAGSVLPPSFQISSGADGTISWTVFDAGKFRLRRYANGRSALPPLDVTHGFGAWASSGPLDRGGYVVVGLDENVGIFSGDIVAYRLSAFGQPVGDPITVADDASTFDTHGPTVAPIAAGFVVVWNDFGTGDVRAHRYGYNGAALGPPIAVGPIDFGDAVPSASALPGGGFLVTWGRRLRARAFDADGQPLSNGFIPGNGLVSPTAAVSADGTRAVAVGLSPEDDPAPNEVRARIFAPGGGVLVDDLVVAAYAPEYRLLPPSVAYDLNGNFVVVWGESDSFYVSRGNVWAQAFDGSGTPIRERRLLKAEEVHTGFAGATVLERRRDGGFFALWMRDFTVVEGVRFTLCAPASNVCGDGVEVSTCEVCDDGAGNSDTTPDACRTDCHPAHCGDGVADTGEECDDGNPYYCDGCTPSCAVEPGIVCGDGIIPPGCNEQCDDANTVAGDGCANDCTVERIVGGGSPLSDCWAAWRVENPSNVPLRDSRGAINRKQRCRDGDPACDFDAVEGQCTFRVAVCVNNSEPRECDPRRLLTWSVRKPSAKQGAKDPALAAMRSALAAVVLPNVVGAATPNLCSPAADVALPLKGAPGAWKASKLTLGADATTYDGAIDRDGLALRCDP